MVANIHLSPAPQSVGSCWYSEISHGGFIYTRSIAEHYKSLQPSNPPTLNPKNCLFNIHTGTSLVVQWLGLRLPVQGVKVRSLIGELGSHMPHSYKT